MEADVVIVGAAPPAWRVRCVCRSSSINTIPLIPGGSCPKENIFVLEKARSLGAHALSGALLDPRSMQELLPGFGSEASLDATIPGNPFIS